MAKQPRSKAKGSRFFQDQGLIDIAGEFEDVQGTIKFVRLQHSWENGKCTFCNANQQ